MLILLKKKKKSFPTAKISDKKYLMESAESLDEDGELEIDELQEDLNSVFNAFGISAESSAAEASTSAAEATASTSAAESTTDNAEFTAVESNSATTENDI